MNQEEEDFINMWGISHIPFEQLRKQYLNYSYELPFSSTDISCGVATEGDKSTPLHEVRLLIKEQFYLDDWQFSMIEAHNIIDIALIIPNIPESKDIIINAMENEGYIRTFECEITLEEMSWLRIHFEPYQNTSST